MKQPRPMGADFEGDCFSDIVMLVYTQVDGKWVVSTLIPGTLVLREDTLVHLAETETVYVDNRAAWDYLRSRYPEAYRLLQGQLDSMVHASRWWSPVHLIDLWATGMDAHIRNIAVTQWLRRTHEPKPIQRLKSIYRYLARIRRLRARIEG
jgi:hypothetical protein